MDRVRMPLDLGWVTPASAGQVADFIVDGAVRHRSVVLANWNLHAVYMYLNDPLFRQLYNEADMLVIDGWPVLKLLNWRRAQKFPVETRIGSTDWLEEILLRDSAIRVVAVGGTPESSRRAHEVVSERCEHLQWVAIDGYEGIDRLCSGDYDEALGRADLILVGLGMPRQERWILENRARWSSAVVANVGGCLDYLSGEQRLAPRWMGGMGIEWLFRLAHDPRRLWRRYLLEPIHLACLLVSWQRQGAPGKTRA
jgi:N-acetylglucosaminyldiphosphoundecaprenol N-acetyl-beta-D-mannosaminyltransferase